MTPREAAEVIQLAIERSSPIPDEMSYIIHDADEDGEQADVSLPMVQLQLSDTSRDDQTNNDLVGYVTDDSGNNVGRIYENTWMLNLRIRVWTVEGSNYDVDAIGNALEAVLYDYDSRGPAQQFTDDDGNVVDEIWDFQLAGSQREDDLGQTPAIRRYRQDAEVRGVRTFAQYGETPITSHDKQITTE